MKFTLWFECENEAFQDGNLNTQVAEILATLSRGMEASQGPMSGDIFDPNGNRIGFWKLA